MEVVLSGYKSQLPSVIEKTVNGADVIHMKHRSFCPGFDRMRIVTHKIKNDAVCVLRLQHNFCR